MVIGPEAPLVSGLVNDLVSAGISAFGPSAEAAALEGSKDFMKRLCDKYGIPTAKVTPSLLLLPLMSHFSPVFCHITFLTTSHQSGCLHQSPGRNSNQNP